MRWPTSWHGELCVVGGETLLYPRVGGVCTNLRVIKQYGTVLYVHEIAMSISCF